MTHRTFVAGALAGLLAACTAPTGGLVASSPQEACEIEASLLFGLPVNAVSATGSSTESGELVVTLDLSGGTADCRIGPDQRVSSIELR